MLPWVATGAPSFLPELVDQLLQFLQMLLGLELFATLLCLFAKPVLEILVGLFLLLRRDVAIGYAVQPETAATCRDGLEVAGGSRMALQGSAQGVLVDVGECRDDGFVYADRQGLGVTEYGISGDHEGKDRTAVSRLGLPESDSGRLYVRHSTTHS